MEVVELDEILYYVRSFLMMNRLWGNS